MCYSHEYKLECIELYRQGIWPETPEGIKTSNFHLMVRYWVRINETKVTFMANKTNSLSHTKWMCKYHIVFSPKYRRKIIYNQYRKSLQDIIRTLCRYKGVEIIEGHVMPDHIHLVLSIPPKISVSSFIGYLKGKNCFDDVREAYES